MLSPPEALLWQRLRERPNGIKFRRQHPVDPYIVDFYCRSANLVIEIDGWAHETQSRAASDQVRDRCLAERGLSILRLAAADVLRDADSAVCAIMERVGSPLHQPAAGPPPRSGEDG